MRKQSLNSKQVLLSFLLTISIIGSKLAMTTATMTAAEIAAELMPLLSSPVQEEDTP